MAALSLHSVYWSYNTSSNVSSISATCLCHHLWLCCCSVGGLITPQPAFCNFNGACLQFLRPPAQTPQQLRGCSHIMKAGKLMVQNWCSCDHYIIRWRLPFSFAFLGGHMLSCGSTWPRIGIENVVRNSCNTWTAAISLSLGNGRHYNICMGLVTPSCGQLTRHLLPPGPSHQLSATLSPPPGQSSLHLTSVLPVGGGSTALQSTALQSQLTVQIILFSLSTPGLNQHWTVMDYRLTDSTAFNSRYIFGCCSSWAP